MSAIIKSSGATLALPEKAIHSVPRKTSIKSGKAKSITPKGQVAGASPTPQSRAAVTRMPEKAIGRLPRETPSSVVAAQQFPRGHLRNAATPPLPQEAGLGKPKGRITIAPAAPSQSRKANSQLPKGQTTVASETPSNPRKARHLMPKGQRKFASADPLAVAASRDAPKGHPNVAAQQPSSSGGQMRIADKAIVDVPPEPPLDAAGQLTRAKQAVTTLPSASIQSIRELHRQRQDFHRAEKSLTLQMKAVCRRLCDGDKDAGNALFDSPDERVDMLVGPFMQARSILERNRKATEKSMERLAKELPAVSFVESVLGFGIGSLAAIVGECGDLNNYSTHSKLWKRMGLAPMNGKAMATWRKGGGLTSDQWQQAGYSPTRRSIMWNIGSCVMKAQSAKVNKETGEVLKRAGPYRALYDARKELELTRCETKGHANNRALRYLDKRILRDLWKAWRKIGEGHHAPA